MLSPTEISLYLRAVLAGDPLPATPDSDELERIWASFLERTKTISYGLHEMYLLGVDPTDNGLMPRNQGARVLAWIQSSFIDFEQKLQQLESSADYRWALYTVGNVYREQTRAKASV